MADPIVPVGVPSAHTAGVDEAGRGPLAGPVYAAAVILDPHNLPEGITDSKALSAVRRERLAGEIQRRALASAVAFVSVVEIDRLNILQASLLAMRRAIEALAVVPSLALIDGNRCPDGLRCPAQAVIKGDRSVVAIGAASILAKVARDQEMVRLDQCYPGYGFAQHKGYGTKAHLDALQRLGVCCEHRRSFAPVRALIARADQVREQQWNAP
ncbi:ribonuclease HII [Halochromatium glycolicum]|jgi:ribonuclease HII|uniref:Ribonuclease HII n=1 Tax=Halochromatium glycolicum TaxID=85075 RepID=A0AAJ0U219_9GAMM|nr:ribonuclease HII [Halochromatium glycolicum]MBK1703845.1 ribonuclease HII [Halochromatium glycolicum]